MRWGIIGLPRAGKTTVFNALTGAGLPTGEHGARPVEVHTATVDVPDARLEALNNLLRPKKLTHAKVTYADIGGLRADAGREGLPGPLLNQLTQMDGFVHVARDFEDANLPHPAGSVDAARDVAAMEAEFLLNDLLSVERRLERAREERRKGARDKAILDREIELFEKVLGTLSEEKPLRGIAYQAEEERVLSGFGLLSRKPLLVVLNIAEGELAGEAPTSLLGALAVLGQGGLAGETKATSKVGELGLGAQRMALQGKLEMEIAQLPPEQAADFLAEFGLPETGRARIIRTSYDLLRLITFFTFNEDEGRAWALRRGGTALEAAGTIHSDLERGFIRAEVIDWQGLCELGGLAAARAAGKLRLEGKTYPISDGELVTIRFHV